MIWHEAKGPEIAEFAKTCDTALIPVGCVELHGPHCPTGVDALIAERTCRLTQEIEPCIVLPTIFYNINDQMKCYPGTISIPHRVVTEMYRAIFRECARNGFKRIVVGIFHGGAEEAVTIAQADILQEITDGHPIDYQVFRVDAFLLGEPRLGDEYDGHGGRDETAMVMDAVPGLVDLSLVKGEFGQYLPPVADPAVYRVDWIRNVPKGFEGRPEMATRELGEEFNRETARQLAEIIRKIKAYDFATSP